MNVRIGYIIAEAAQGQGLATELVAGLVDWARAQPTIHALTGGIASAYGASARVLVNNGFELIGSNNDEATYRVGVAPTPAS